MSTTASDVLGATKRWLLDGLDFALDTALGLTIRGHFNRVAGSYEVGADGTRIELAVDATSVDTGNGIWDGLLRSADSRQLTEHPQVRFRSTRVRELGDGTLRVEGSLEAAGKIEPVAFDAAVKGDEQGLQLEAITTVDRHQFGKSADRFAVFLPATVHVTMRFRP
jgi:polyisoprenoid-binding protein YceI